MPPRQGSGCARPVEMIELRIARASAAGAQHGARIRKHFETSGRQGSVCHARALTAGGHAARHGGNKLLVRKVGIHVGAARDVQARRVPLALHLGCGAHQCNYHFNAIAKAINATAVLFRARGWHDGHSGCLRTGHLLLHMQRKVAEAGHVRHTLWGVRRGAVLAQRLR